MDTPSDGDSFVVTSHLHVYLDKGLWLDWRKDNANERTESGLQNLKKKKTKFGKWNRNIIQQVERIE